MESRWCTACAKPFVPRSQSPHQTYCPEPDCQRERRRLWQKAKRISDPDYLENQLQAQRAWNGRNPDYWRAYRADHPAYVATNRLKQRTRNDQGAMSPVAKMDASAAAIPLQDGLYTLTLLDPVGVAKMGVWTVRLTLAVGSSGSP